MKWSSFYRQRPSVLARLLFSKAWWRVSPATDTLYLTFDDGPHNSITPWVLDVLKEYDAKATFFCLGKNVEQYPEIYARIINEGHAVGNHTHQHLNGWNTSYEKYWADIEHCATHVKSNLFRPPYGRISLGQYKMLLKKGFHIVMWDVLSGDFDEKLPANDCLANLKHLSRPGSIITFHDSAKAANTLQQVLPGFLRHFTGKGMKFNALDGNTDTRNQ